MPSAEPPGPRASSPQGPPRASGSPAPPACDLAVVGGGIVGLAVARELTRRYPRASVCVLEREADIATHQSGHSSGVIHSGVYYAPGSLKARLCVQGARELFDYCDARNIAAERSGKLILATSPGELGRLDELERRAKANGVPAVRRVEAAGIAAIEPHARGLRALHLPSTGVVDFRQVARAYADDVLHAGGVLVTSCPVKDVIIKARSLRLEHAHGATEAGSAVFCAGAWSDRLAVLAGAGPDPRIVPFRGAYLRLAAEHRHLVRALVYPVPDPALPFLGVHLTRQLDGEVMIGPTALLTLARDGYSLRSLRRRDALDTLRWPGTWRLLARSLPAAGVQLRLAASRAALVRAAARLVPALATADAGPAFAGVRAQALGRDGRLIDDFAFSRTARALHVRNAPSPAATASLAIARLLADEAQRQFDLAG